MYPCVQPIPVYKFDKAHSVYKSDSFKLGFLNSTKIKCSNQLVSPKLEVENKSPSNIPIRQHPQFGIDVQICIMDMIEFTI